MVEEVLVKASLSSEEIRAGEELLKWLDAAQADVIAAYWIYSPSVGEWHLELVSPQVESEGPLASYTGIYDALYPKGKIGLDLSSIMVLGPNYTFYKLLRSTLKTEKELSGVRLNRHVVGDEIVDLYIYRFPPHNPTA